MKLKLAAIASIAVAAILIFIYVPSMLTDTSAERPSDTGVSAAISFRSSNLINTNYPSADYFSVAPSPFQSVTLYAVTQMDGTVVDNTNMIVELKGKIITGGVPVSGYAITGTTQVLIDNTVFKTSQISYSGTGAPPIPIKLNIDANPELSVPVTSMKNFWGIYNYGDHKIVISVDALLVVNFVDGERLTKTFKSADVGSVTLTSSSDATTTFTVESNYNSAGTTTEPAPQTAPAPTPQAVQVTDTWATSGSAQSFGSNGEYAYQQRIDDPNRMGAEIKSVTFVLYIPGSSYTAGYTYVQLLDSAKVVKATTTYIHTSAISSVKSYTFEFPAGTMTPNSTFYIRIVGAGGLATQSTVDTSYASGTAELVNFNNGATSALGKDLAGSATYIIYQ